MKKLPVAALIAFILLASAGLAWWFQGHPTKAASATPATAAEVRNAPNAPVVTQIIPRDTVPPPGANLWQEYALARHTALEQNPELAAEYKELLEEMKAQQQKLEAAIVRVNPKTASVLTKYKAMRERHLAMMDSPAPTPATSK